MTNEMAKMDMEIEKLRKQRDLLLEACKMALILGMSGGDVKGLLQEAVNQIELSGRL